MNTRLRGFTLVELMVTLVILAVLLVIAAPSYREFIVDSRMNSEANEFLTSLNFTRSEAVKRNARVSMCKSSSGAACVTSGNWEQGWIVFVDVDNGPESPRTFDTGTDTILRVHGPLTAGSTLVGTGQVADFVSFVADGRSMIDAVVPQAGTFDLGTAGVSARTVCLALGRAHVTKTTC